MGRGVVSTSCGSYEGSGKAPSQTDEQEPDNVVEDGGSGSRRDGGRVHCDVFG